ncbi:unnamed protein product, partial [Schistocephalus solidus]|uniref:Ubiquitin carboxyl-terminal hydrolase n=1 Tax=Schistocephalus solidus TaxID=70667 RepID=A0A183SEN2_SCHSO
FIRQLGVPKSVGFTDVLGVDPVLQALVPKPVYALLLLYPINENVDSQKIGDVSVDENCFFLKQTISNACGTIAVLHALANIRDKIDTTNMTWLNNFIKQTQSLSPAERGEKLEREQAPDATAKVDLHFVTFVNCHGKLIELDGRREGPVCHGTTSADSLLSDACNAAKKFMERDAENLLFSLIALTELQD